MNWLIQFWSASLDNMVCLPNICETVLVLTVCNGPGIHRQISVSKIKCNL